MFSSCAHLFQLCDLGIDLRYQLDGLLRSPLQRALNDARDKAVEAVKLRATEDKWHPTNLGSKDSLTKFVMETGLTPGHMQKYVQGTNLIVFLFSLASAFISNLVEYPWFLLFQERVGSHLLLVQWPLQDNICLCLRTV